MKKQISEHPTAIAMECQNHSRLGFYRFMSKFSFLNFRAKIMMMAFLGTHIPLLALVFWQTMQGSHHWSEALPTLGVALAATLIGTATTLFVLNQLLRPVLLTSTTLRDYQKKPEAHCITFALQR